MYRGERFPTPGGKEDVEFVTDQERASAGHAGQAVSSRAGEEEPLLPLRAFPPFLLPPFSPGAHMHLPGPC